MNKLEVFVSIIYSFFIPRLPSVKFTSMGKPYNCKTLEFEEYKEKKGGNLRKKW